MKTTKNGGSASTKSALLKLACFCALLLAGCNGLPDRTAKDREAAMPAKQEAVTGWSRGDIGGQAPPRTGGERPLRHRDAFGCEPFIPDAEMPGAVNRKTLEP